MNDNDNNYEGFTIWLAVVDALPVLFFGGSCVLLGMISGSPLFVAGALVCFLGGLLKVLWKIILAIKRKDIHFLNKQMKYSISTGFVMIFVSFAILLVKQPGIISNIVKSVLEWPFILCFVIWIIGMFTMAWLAKHLDSAVARNNWIEQSVNGIAQLSLFIGLLYLYNK